MTAASYYIKYFLTLDYVELIKCKIVQAEHPWSSKEHIRLDKLQGDPKGQTCQYFHGGKICKRDR